MQGFKKKCYFLQNICCVYLLKLLDKAIITNIHKKCFRYFITLFLNISNYLFHLKPRIHSIQIVVITSFVVILNAGIKRVDCTSLLLTKKFDNLQVKGKSGHKLFPIMELFSRKPALRVHPKDSLTSKDIDQLVGQSAAISQSL